MYSCKASRGGNKMVEEKKKKATFELEESLHTQLKIQAATEGKKMIDIVQIALRDYFNKKNKE